MNIPARRNIFLVLAFIGAVIVMVFTLFVMIGLHIGRFLFQAFFQREKSPLGSKDAKHFQQTVSSMGQSFETKRRPIKTIEAEVNSAESISIKS